MKERLDVLLVNRGLAPSREKAKTMIMEGNVFVNNNREDKAGSTFPDDCNIEIHGKTLQYVSRGGLKLEKAMKHFDITMDGNVEVLKKELHVDAESVAKRIIAAL